MSRFLNWLADLHEPQRSRHMPRTPMTPAVRSDFERLMAEARKPRAVVDHRMVGIELEAAWFSAQIELAERDLRRQLRVCYGVIAGLVAALVSIAAALVSIAIV